MSKNVGAAPNLEDLNTAMASRYTEQTPTTTTAQVPAPAATPEPAPARPATTRRSWLLPTDVADAMTAAANRIHHGSGGEISKSDAQAAIIRAGLQHESEIAEQLLPPTPEHS